MKKVRPLTNKIITSNHRLASVLHRGGEAWGGDGVRAHGGEGDVGLEGRTPSRGGRGRGGGGGGEVRRCGGRWRGWGVAGHKNINGQ